ncbi:hypothetical protein JQC67_12930 [Aurantibacter crassamenti]|uniref:hypothetical protein n=1 Tax=Aurantibacter crassamenti TaxID=1837375 RepID=UPI001939F8C8|nr:hypothetical protein [Aurantibacter crassamenti]MBM1107049.1 hypothetical protein [Aurantibacter crassamenti]
MNKFIVIISFILVSSQLWSQKNIDLTSDEYLVKFFNVTEIKGLESMISYVDNMVLNRKNITDTNKAYHLFFEEIARSKAYIIPFGDIEKYEFLESLNPIQFATIWRFGYKMSMINTGDTIYRNLDNFKMLNVKSNSKYMDYLKEIGKNDPYFKFLQQEFEGAGSLMADSAEWFPKNHAQFDFNIPKNRLWAVVFILRIEETLEMKLDRYLKNNKNNLPE